MSRNERAEGLEVALVLLGAGQSKTPSGDVWPAPKSGRRLPWLAAMRSAVAVWKSSFLWRQTDDEHTTCACGRRECSAEVLFCRHYVLGGCTDETSAYKTDKTSACPVFIEYWALCGACWPVVATFVLSRLRAPSTAARPLTPRIFSWKKRHRGWPRQPHLFDL